MQKHPNRCGQLRSFFSRENTLQPEASEETGLLDSMIQKRGEMLKRDAYERIQYILSHLKIEP